MIEEPYRWVEAIANRREYIETQLASGNPIAAVSFHDGILFLTVGRTGQKIFEVYNRIAMGAIGHPGDIERCAWPRLKWRARKVHALGRGCLVATDGALFAQPRAQNRVRADYGAPYLARCSLPKWARTRKRICSCA